MSPTIQADPTRTLRSERLISIVADRRDIGSLGERHQVGSRGAPCMFWYVAYEDLTSNRKWQVNTRRKMETECCRDQHLVRAPSLSHFLISVALRLLAFSSAYIPLYFSSIKSNLHSVASSCPSVYLPRVFYDY